MITVAGSGHPGGSLSCLDLLVTLFSNHLKHSKTEDPNRDRFILSKGHGVPALYAVLAEHGYFDKALLPTLRKLGSPLQGHPVRGTLPGIEACTGSLGQGLSVAVGMALGAKIQGANNGRVYTVVTLMGDGEIQEGQVWEAIMSAAKFKLGNLIAIVDLNRAQIDGLVSDVMPIEPMREKWEAFGWTSKRIDGHDHKAIDEAYTWAFAKDGSHDNSPKVILADTIKGKGVSFMESELLKWHGSAPSKEQCEAAIAELENQIITLKGISA